MDYVGSFHSPRVLIIITHHNYCQFIEGALESVREQSYTNFRCIVVDDFSAESQYLEVCELVRDLGDNRFSVLRCDENVGQIHATYAALERQDSVFVSILDPDDRYAPDFLQRMVGVHLNPHVFCPIVSCDQRLLKLGNGIITGTKNTKKWRMLVELGHNDSEETYRRFGFHRYVPPTENGWHWTTTSAMMFRTDALLAIAPRRKLHYKVAVDAYCANGTHMMGGSIILDVPLVYRGLHSSNDFISNRIFSVFQSQEREGAVFLSDSLKLESIRSFFENNSHMAFSLEDVALVLSRHFSDSTLEEFWTSVPGLRNAYQTVLQKMT